MVTPATLLTRCFYQTQKTQRVLVEPTKKTPPTRVTMGLTIVQQRK